MAILNYFDAIRMLLRKGTIDDPYAPKTDQISIINNKASLDEIPDPLYHVIIDSYVEIYKDAFDEVKTIASNQFYVNYQTGMLYFNESENGKTLTATYKGRGVIQYPAERIFIHSPNPWVVDNLQQFIDLIFSKIQEITDKVVQFTNYVDTKYNEYVAFVQTKTDEFTTFVNDKTAQFTAYVDSKTTYLEGKVIDFTNYVNTFIAKGDAKIAEMDTEILNAQTATENANTATTNAQNATAETIAATNDLATVKDAAIQATNDAIVATTDANTATANAEAETTAMHVDRLNTRLIWQQPVNTFSDIAIQYPTPDVGWAVMTKNNGNVYRWSGVDWTLIENLSGSIPDATPTDAGLLSADLYNKLIDIEANAQVNFTGEQAKTALPDYFRYKTFVFILSGELFATVQNVLLQCPSTGILKNVSAFCQTAGADNTLIQVDKISQGDFQNNVDSWSPILDINYPIIFEYAQKVADLPQITQPNILQGDYLRVRILQLGAGIQDITIQLNVEI